MEQLLVQLDEPVLVEAVAVHRARVLTVDDQRGGQKAADALGAAKPVNASYSPSASRMDTAPLSRYARLPDTVRRQCCTGCGPVLRWRRRCWRRSRDDVVERRRQAVNRRHVPSPDKGTTVSDLQNTEARMPLTPSFRTEGAHCPSAPQPHEMRSRSIDPGGLTRPRSAKASSQSRIGHQFHLSWKSAALTRMSSRWSTGGSWTGWCWW